MVDVGDEITYDWDRTMGMFHMNEGTKIHMANV